MATTRRLGVRRFWRTIATFLFGAILGTAFGVAAGIFAFPYVFPPPVVSEHLPDSERATLIADGNFIHADPADPIHWGRGKVGVYQRSVFLESDFEVGPGPAFHVYLVPKAEIRGTADMRDVMFVDLGGLKSFKGSQRYAIPAGVDLSKYPSVIIWCREFGVLISPADLKPVAK